MSHDNDDDPVPTDPTEPAPQGSPPAGDRLDQLRKLADLHRDGVLTDEEFAEQKQGLLHTGVAPAAPARAPRRRPSRKVVLAVLALLLLGGGAGGAALKISHDNDVKAKSERKRKAADLEERKEAARVAAQIAADEAEREEAEEAEAADDLEITLREGLIQSLRKSVTADFRKRVTEGQLDGPILGTSCDPVSGGVEDLEETTGKYECLVATERTGGGGRRGYPVEATVNYTKSSYTWQLSD